jgi:hypothetical protein
MSAPRVRFRRIGIALCIGIALHQAITAVRALDPAPIGSIPPALAFTAGVLWAAAFAFAAGRIIGAWHGNRSGAHVSTAWIMIAAFAAYSGVRLFIFARADYDRGRDGFLFILCGLIIIISLFIAARAAISPPLRERATDGAES